MKRIVAIAAVLCVTALGVAACSETYPNLSSLAPAKVKYTATLLGTNEAPTPVTTTAAGTMTLTKEDSVTILYDIVTTARTDSITMAHIHAGAAGVAGPIMVCLRPTRWKAAPISRSASSIMPTRSSSASPRRTRN